MEGGIIGKKVSLILLAVCYLWTFAQVFAEGKNYGIPKLSEVGGNISAFVSKGWKIIKQGKGDLNQDKLADITGVIEYDKKMKEGEASPRVLFIALKQKQGGFKLSIQTENAILDSMAGGVFGDPFEDLAVDRGSVLISFYGGSNWRWAYRYRFRYHDGGWYMIGATTASFHILTGEEEDKDYNLLTGKMIKTVIDDRGHRKETTIDRGRKKLVNLEDFNVYSADKQY